jgi:pimeloyl-ACP methyl ester carboxylesterase
VISGGADSSADLEADVAASLEAMGEAGVPIAASWEEEKTVATEDELRELLRVQMPFHFAGDPPPGYAEDPVGTPDVLRHFAQNGYGDFDYRPAFGRVTKPSEKDRTTTPRAARVLHDGIANSRLTIIPGVGHMSFVEAPGPYMEAVRAFLREVAAGRPDAHPPDSNSD